MVTTMPIACQNVSGVLGGPTQEELIVLIAYKFYAVCVNVLNVNAFVVIGSIFNFTSPAFSLSLSLVQQYGDVLNVVMSNKKKGSAVVEFASVKAAVGIQSFRMLSSLQI